MADKYSRKSGGIFGLWGSSSRNKADNDGNRQPSLSLIVGDNPAGYNKHIRDNDMKDPRLRALLSNPFITEVISTSYQLHLIHVHSILIIESITTLCTRMNYIKLKQI